MRLRRKKTFVKSFKKLSVKMKDKVLRILEIFEENPLHPTLRNHALKGEYFGMRSVDVTGDVRIIFKEHDGYIEVILVDVGTHSQLYT